MGDSLDIATSATKVHKRMVDLASQNVANADTPGFRRLDADLISEVNGGGVQGVSIAKIRHAVSEELTKIINARTALGSAWSLKAHYYKKIQDLLSKVDDHDSVGALTSRLFNAIGAIDASGGSIESRTDAVTQANEFAVHVRNLVESLQEFRVDLDSNIVKMVETVNTALSNIHKLNGRMLVEKKNTVESLSLEDQLNLNVEVLSRFFEVRTYYDERGKFTIKLPKADIEILGGSLGQLSYIPALSTDVFIQGQALNPIYVTYYGDGGNNVSIPRPLIGGGSAGTIVPNLGEGELSALIEMRDMVIPHLLSEIENFTVQTVQKFNAVHNSGSGSVPPVVLTAQQYSTAASTYEGTGSVKVMLVDEQGNVAQADEIGSIPAWNIDLGVLQDTNGIPGTWNLEALMNEINSGFDGSIVKVGGAAGGLSNVRLAALSKQVTANVGGSYNQFAFDVDLSAYVNDSSVQNIDFQIQNVIWDQGLSGEIEGESCDVLDSNLLLPTGPANSKYVAFTNSPIALPNGTSQRTFSQKNLQAPLISVNSINSNDFTGQHTLTVTVLVTYGISQYTATLDIPVDLSNGSSINGLLNKRFSANAVLGDGELLQSGTTLLSAQLVDDNGIPVLDSNSSGYLSLTSNSGNWRIAVDQGTTNIIGTQNGTINNIGAPLNEFFGLNNLFVNSASNLLGSFGAQYPWSTNISVRTDIIATPSFLSLSTPTMKMLRSSTGVFSTPFYTLGGSNTALFSSYQNLRDQGITFQSTGALPSVVTTLERYMSMIVSDINDQTNTSIYEEEVVGGVLFDLKTKLQSEVGVNIDVELSNITRWQMLFAASAKLITVWKEMHAQLLASF